MNELLLSCALLGAVLLAIGLARMLVRLDRRHCACRRKLAEVAAERDTLRAQRDGDLRRELADAIRFPARSAG